MFNVITYTLMVAQLCVVWFTEYEHREFYTHIFNGCYAALMFVVVVFFLIYGVEVFFKVRRARYLNSSTSSWHFLFSSVHTAQQ